MTPYPHIDYHAVLDALKTHQDQCPLCAFTARGEEGYFESMLYSWVGTEGFQDRFLATDGFCRDHAHGLAQRNDGVAVTMLYLPLLTHRRRWLQRRTAHPVLRLWRRIRSRRDRSPAARGERAEPAACPLCTQITQWEVQFLRNLVRHAGDTDLRDAFTTGYGLCLPHYGTLVDSSRSVPDWIVQLQDRKMDTLVEAVNSGIPGATPWRELLEYMEGPPGASRGYPGKGGTR